MTDRPEWKKSMGESNALGWIAFMLLVAGIGVGTILFGSDSLSVKDRAQATDATAPKGLK